MPRKCHRAKYQHLSPAERDQNLQLYDLGLSMRAIATCIIQEANTIQQSMVKGSQDYIKTRRGSCGSRRRMTNCPDKRISRAC
ncbi:hypothetical protein TNCV_1041711 [Trichonephila clavipes]|nr:hypothetical protein TNCV_1041711 [Trichonephila clavipes]